MKPAPLIVPDCPHRDDRAQLWNLLRDLHPRQGTALLLLAGFHLPQQRVAAVLGVPQNTVSWLCSQAVRAVQARASVTCADRR